MTGMFLFRIVLPHLVKVFLTHSLCSDIKGGGFPSKILLPGNLTTCRLSSRIGDHHLSKVFLTHSLYSDIREEGGG